MTISSKCVPGSDLAKMVAALQLVLHHCPDVVSSPKKLGKLALTCKAVKRMLQAQPLARTNIRVDNLHISRLAVFSHWLTAYAGMVNSIDISLDEANEPLGCDNLMTYKAVAEQLLILSLQKSVTTYQTPLCLQSFGSNFMHTPAVLGALAGASVKELRLQGLPAADLQKQAQVAPTAQHALTTAFTVALAGLTTLTLLSLATDRQQDLALPYAPALAKLTTLRHLRLQQGCLPAEKAAHLPCSLEYLDVGLNTPGPVPLSHLTNLQNLTLHVYTELVEDSALPPNLTTLGLRGEGRVGCLHLSGLPKLQILLIGGVTDVDQLLVPSLKDLASLTFLGLCNVQLSTLAMLTPMWQHTKLSSLLIIPLGSAQSLDFSGFCKDIGKAVSLECLHLFGQYIECQQQTGTVDVCMQLRALTSLSDLTLHSITCMTRRDLMHLTVLTALKCLSLSGCGTEVDDAVATAIGRRLSQLQFLRLKRCGLSSVSPLPALALLTDLRNLDLSDNSRFACDDAGLMMLSTLSKLNYLHIDKEHLTEVGIQQFVAAVHGVVMGPW